jgi:hypothetical protein
MSGVLRPVGPERQGTYWVRRLVVLVIAVLVVLLLAHACSSGGGSTPSGATAATSPTPSSASPVSPAPTPTGVTTCPKSALTVTISSDKRDYAAGDTPRFTAKLRTTGTTPCSVRSGASRQQWTVTSGRVETWTTAGCVGSSKAATVTLRPHHAHVVSITWNGRRRGTDCRQGAAATGGTYVLSATIDGAKATPVVFRIGAG